MLHFHLNPENFSNTLTPSQGWPQCWGQLVHTEHMTIAMAPPSFRPSLLLLTLPFFCSHFFFYHSLILCLSWLTKAWHEKGTSSRDSPTHSHLAGFCLKEPPPHPSLAFRGNLWEFVPPPPNLRVISPRSARGEFFRPPPSTMVSWGGYAGGTT